MPRGGCLALLRAGGAVAATLCCALSPSGAAAQVSQCRIEFPRGGFFGASLYVNDKNEAYVLARFADPRFDDTSEVFRLRDCKSVGSGVTAKSNFAQTFQAGGFREHAVQARSSREVVNSIYGRVGLTLSSSGIEARVNTVTPDRLAGLQALKDLVTLRRAVPATALRMISDDEQLAVLEDAEFADVQPNALAGEVLARLYLGLPGDYRALEGTRVHRILSAHYPGRLTDAVRARLPADAALAGTLDDHFVRRLAALPPVAGLADIAALYATMGEVKHHSPAVVRGYLAALSTRASFEALLDGFQNVHEAPFLKSDSAGRREVALILDSAVQKQVATAPNRLAAVTAAYTRLLAAGYGSLKIRQLYMETAFASADLGGAIQLHRHVSDDADFRGDAGAVDRAKDLAARRYVESVSSVADAQAAAVARAGLIKLDAAGLKTAAATNLCESTIRRAGKFQDAVDVFRATNDWTLVDRLQAMAKTQAELAALETVAVRVVSSPAVLLEADFTFDSHHPLRNEDRHAGVFALYTLNVDHRFSGVVQLRNRKGAPLTLQYGPYKVDLVVKLLLDTFFERKSRFLGNAERNDSRTVVRHVSVIVHPDGKGTVSGDGRADWGTQRVFSFKRGSHGGYDAEGIRDLPIASVSIDRIEPVSP